MAVTFTVSEVARSIRAVESPDVLAELTRLLAYASAEVTRISPLAPDQVHNRAATQIVGYAYDRPTASKGMAFASILRNSGAGAVLLPYRFHRAGSTATGDSDETALD